MGKFSPIVLALLVSAATSGCSGTTQVEADFAGGWSVDELIETGIRGVSPELIELAGTPTLFVTSLDPQRVWEGTVDGAFQPSSKNVPPGADFTAIDEGDHWRMFWTDFTDTPQPGQPMSPDAKKRVVSAITNDFLNYEPATPTGVQQETPGPAWGVPDTVIGPDGQVHMYWVDEVDGESSEVLRHATSADGITFRVDADPVMFGGYVDPYVLRAVKGDWLMLVSTTPHPSRLPQKIHLARSVDGIAWEVDPSPILSDPDTNYLDPTAYPLSESSWRLIVASSPKDAALDPNQLVLLTGVLTAPAS